ncbi:MAG: hypothetical protein JKY52_13330 [Flavobacteriales bacterium]|nr:hypothetical protein [Flavobacteriales bacterium]
MLGALLSALVLLVAYFSFQLFWFAPVTVIALCYTLALIPARGRWVRLRDIPYLKIFIIVSVVTYISFCMPFLWHEGLESSLLQPSVKLMILGRALFLFAITLPFDIRDLDFDKNTRLKTIPGAVGVRNSKIISLVVLAAFVLVEWVHYVAYAGDAKIFLALAASGVVAGILVIKAQPSSSEYFYSLGLEGTMIVQFLLVLLASAI